MTRLWLLLVSTAFLGLSALATDTAFWKPYETDAATFYLEHFDTDAAPEGIFGGAHQGPTPHTQAEPRLFVKNTVSLEAWVKLAAMPKERAYVIRRTHAPDTTNGFELFVEPDGGIGLTIVNVVGKKMEMKSATGLMTTGKWVHLGAISNDAYILYINGEEIKRVRRQAGMAGIGIDNLKESVAAPVIAGEGVPGLVDEVRVHSNVNKLWPKPEQSWIAKHVGQALPASDIVLAPGHAPILYVPFDGDISTPINLKDAKLVGKGESFVDGVRGKAIRGSFTATGTLAEATEGAIEFWCRPLGINNYSDQNLTLFSNSLFSFYLFNSPSEFRALSLYYYDAEKKIHFAGDNRETDVYPDKWNHYLFTWGSGKIDWYVNGEKAGGSDANFAAKILNNISFNPYQLFGDIDELYVYDKELSTVEAANAYWRYAEPANVKKARRNLASLRFWHMPSSRELFVQLQASSDAVAKSPVSIQLKNASGKIVFTSDAAFSQEPQHFVLPELKSGDYALNLKIGEEETDPQTLKRQIFPWEKNNLGITDEVFTPFTPIKTKGEQVSVVLRDHRMNKFGLWDSVMAKDKEILAGPMRIVAVDENNKDLEWKGKVEKVSDKKNLAVYKASSTCTALGIEATSEMEMDGMMKVKLTLNPVEKPVSLKRLSIEIPLRDDVATLLHESTDIIRSSYSGSMPAIRKDSVDGEIWNSKQSNRQPAWLNAFTSYIWMGGPERGLAWFAENDKGWITAKNNEMPLMRIFREKGRVTLRIDLVNLPGVITKPTELVFGVQASPSKPVPADYRSKALTLGGVGLPVHPWGGLSCSWKSPWMDKWEVVDKVIEGRNGGKVDRAWFEKFEKEFDVPKVHGVNSWVEDVCRFAGRTTPLSNPDPVYFEEMHVLPFIPEYHVFQDEWSRDRLSEKSTASIDIYRNSGGREVNPNEHTNYSRSYQDYTLSLMNEWMKRGVSMYWDNTYLKVASNPWTSAAYVCADGRTQPATILWNARGYMKRTWNLMNEWRRKGVPRPLEFVAHMTNQEILPLFSWSTCNYDIEMSQSVYARAFPDSYEPGEPYTPEFLLTESTGLQVGAYPYIVHAIFEGQCKLPAEALGTAPSQIETGRREWGMRMVHEIIRGGPSFYLLPISILDKSVYDFGYGGKDVDVWNYWADTQAFKINNENIKGLLLTRKSDSKMLLVLQSWSKNPVAITVTFISKTIGFKPGNHVYDSIGNRHLVLKEGTLSLNLDFPYETGIYIIDDLMPEADILFSDDFNAGLNPGWDYLSFYATTKENALRFGENMAPWQGSPRLFKWMNLPDFSDAVLGFSFRIERVPEKSSEILSSRFPADGMSWSKHGLSHSDVNGGVLLQAIADPAKGFMWRATREQDAKTSVLGEGISGPLDTGSHRVEISTVNGTYSVIVDGKTVISVDSAISTAGNAFGIKAVANPAASIGALYLDDIVLRASKIDRTRLEAERQKALTCSAEVVSAQVNELKRKITATFGVFDDSELYRLSMFRNPEADAATLLERFKGISDVNKKKVLLELLKELPSREKEHVEAMKKIGQPADRLPQFKKARKETMRLLQEQLKDADKQTGPAIEDALATIKE